MLYNLRMDMFGALADPTRRYILELLASSGELPATALYEHFPVSPQAVSQYLKVLREAHVVVMEKRAPKRVYCLNQETISQFEAWVRITRQRNMHQAKLGSQEGGRVSRRGEGGGCGDGRAFMVARAGEASVFLQAGRQGNRTRATIKAHPTAPHHPRPYGI